MSNLNGVQMENEFTLHDTDSDSSFRESLMKTGGTISENFACLSQQERSLLARIKMIKTRIEEYQQREPKLREYANNILIEKQRLEEEMKNHQIEVDSAMNSLTTKISEMADTIDELMKKSQSLAIHNDELSRTKNSFSQKVDDMSALELDFTNETTELDARITFYNKEMDKSTRMTPDPEELLVVKNRIDDTDKRQEAVRANCDELKGKCMNLQTELHSVQMEERRLQMQKDTKVHISGLEIDRLKRKLVRAKTEYESECQMREKREILKAQLIDVIDNDETNIESMETETVHAQSSIKTITEGINVAEAGIKTVEGELSELNLTLDFVRQCQNIEEYKRRCAIRDTKQERVAVLRKSGELIFQRKVMKKRAEERRETLAKLSHKMEMAERVSNLLDDGERLAKKREVVEDPAEVSALVDHLNMLNHHIVSALKYNEVLENHKFHDLTPSSMDIPNEVNEKLKQKVKQIRRDNAYLKAKIAKLSKPKPYSAPHLHQCPLFCHTSPETSVHAETEKLELEGRIQQKKAAIQKKRSCIAVKKARLESVSDNMIPGPDTIEGECFKFCNRCANVNGSTREVTFIDAEKLLKKLKMEIETWKYSRFSQTTLLSTWNNQIEHIIRDLVCL